MKRNQVKVLHQKELKELYQERKQKVMELTKTKVSFQKEQPKNNRILKSMRLDLARIQTIIRMKELTDQNNQKGK